MDARYRTRGGFRPGTTTKDETLWVTSCSNNEWQLYSEGANEFLVGDFESMSDVVIPRYHQRSEAGEIFFNPMTRTVVRSLPETGTGRHVRKKDDFPGLFCDGVWKTAEHRQKSQTSELAASAFGFSGLQATHTIPVIGVFSMADVAAMQSEVSTSLLAKRGLADSNLFESLAESDQTLRLLGKPLSSLSSFLDKRASRIALLGPAAAWATYRWGVLPLIRDVNNVIESRSEPLGKRRRSTRVNLSKERTSVDVKPSRDYGGWKTNVQRTCTDIVNLRAVSLDEYAATALSNAGFTGKGLLGLPWELIPFSFVLDWFVNVGDFIYAHVPAFGYTQLGSCITTTRYRTTTYTLLDAFEQPGSQWEMVAPPTGTVFGSIYERTRRAIESPDLQVKTDFRLSDWTRVADLTAAFTLASSKLANSFSLPGKRRR